VTASIVTACTGNILAQTAPLCHTESSKIPTKSPITQQIQYELQVLLHLQYAIWMEGIYDREYLNATGWILMRRILNNNDRMSPLLLLYSDPEHLTLSLVALGENNTGRSASFHAIYESPLYYVRLLFHARSTTHVCRQYTSSSPPNMSENYTCEIEIYRKRICYLRSGRSNWYWYRNRPSFVGQTGPAFRDQPEFWVSFSIEFWEFVCICPSSTSSLLTLSFGEIY